MDVLMIFIEMMLVVLLYNALFNKNKKENLLKYAIIIAICSVLFYNFKNINVLLVYVILLLSEIIAIAIVDKKDKNLVLTEIVICVVITFALQSTLVTVLYLFTKKTKELAFVQLLFFAISILLIIISYRRYTKKKSLDFEEYIEDNLLISNIFLNIFMFFMIYKIIYDSGEFSNLIVIEINLLILINIFLNVNFYRSLHKTVLKNKSIQVKNAYNPLLDDIIENIRANEHEYKNHINILYSMIQVSKDIPELKNRAKKYIGELDNTNILISVIDIESTMIKAILYSKLVECEQHGIKLNYFIDSNIEESCLDESEITIILSNLLNNAIEATKNSLKKEITIRINKSEKNKIEVINSICGLDISNEEIDGFFKKGFSSKGKGRGYGLYNVKKIVKKYKGDIKGRIIEENLVIEILI